MNERFKTDFYLFLKMWLITRQIDDLHVFMGDKFTNQAQQIAAHGNHLSREIGLLKGNFTEKFDHFEKTDGLKSIKESSKFTPKFDYSKISSDISSKIKSEMISQLSAKVTSQITSDLTSNLASKIENKLGSKMADLQEFTKFKDDFGFREPTSTSNSDFSSYNASHVEQLIERQRTHLKRYIDTSRDIMVKDMSRKISNIRKVESSQPSDDKNPGQTRFGTTHFANSCNFSDLFDAHQRQRLLYK